MAEHYEHPYPSSELESQYPFVHYEHERFTEEEMRNRSHGFYEQMERRRSVRMFSSDPVPKSLIETAVKTATQHR